KLGGKPVLASWMGGPEVAAGEAILNAANIPTFSYPDTAARAFNDMWRYTYNLRSIYETPVFPPEENSIDRSRASALIEEAKSSGRTILTEFESKAVLAAYGIPTVDTRIALFEDEAVEYAEAIGYPVVLKLYSETITHKTDVGGVQLNLKSAAAVRDAWQLIRTSVIEKKGEEHFQGVTVQPMIKLEGYELILGSSVDPQFGPVLLFGLGGQLVEVFKDKALGLPPLNSTLARRMMEQTKIYEALKGVRGRKPVDLAALEQLMVRFSQLVVEQRWIKEIDINPLLASPERLVALDARIVIHESSLAEKDLPKLSIRPYPSKYAKPYTLRNGQSICIRPIRPEDEPMMVKFHETLSDQTVYQRYLQMLKLSQRVAHERLMRICFIDYDREIALVAERRNEQGGRELIAVGRLQRLHGTNDAEFAVVLADAYQNQGLGRELVSRLIQIGREEGVDRVIADILVDNFRMQRICEQMGFRLYRSLGDPTVAAELNVQEGVGV
ncbi:MAG TPA: acetyl CoA synthetase subunit alpha, partial [Solibacterales bacterium]|nr:acetyl CoA synthetase subunit alpha [Bryobacterales bacterium]